MPTVLLPFVAGEQGGRRKALCFLTAPLPPPKPLPRIAEGLASLSLLLASEFRFREDGREEEAQRWMLGVDVSEGCGWGRGPSAST